MRHTYWILVAAGVIAGLIVSGRFALRAQDRPPTVQPQPAPPPLAGSIGSGDGNPFPELLPPQGPEPQPASAPHSPNGPTLQDALLRPYHFPFSRPTALEHVCAHLRQTLKAPVVLDLAALDRKKVEPDDTVMLDLGGVRLKTGLKLLLDQVGLTYRVVAEDNLLVITDKEGSEDPIELILSELKALHRDLHDVQDAVDEIRDAFGDDLGEGARVHKPTIIEEMPENAHDAPAAPAEKPGTPGHKPNGAGAPPAGAKPPQGRVPLAGPRRRLSLPGRNR
jgi:hypothetical protein